MKSVEGEKLASSDDVHPPKRKLNVDKNLLQSKTMWCKNKQTRLIKRDPNTLCHLC